MVQQLGGDGSLAWKRAYDPPAVREFFVKALIGFGLNRKASPGMPLKLVADSNGKVIDEYGMLLVYLAEARLRLLMLDPGVVCRLTPLQLVEMYLTDAVRVFVKQEPHTSEKIAQRRMRLISSRGLIDQLVERFLFQEYQDWCIQRWDSLPVKPGMGHTDEMMTKIWDTVQAKLAAQDLDNDDVSGWDFSVLRGRMMNANNVHLRVMNPPELIRNAMINVTWCLATKVWCTSSGALFQQREFGVMASGSFRTADLNSVMRVLLSYEVTFDLGGSERDCFAIAMGDDCVESSFGGFEARKALYAEYGFRLTEHVTIKPLEKFEFTSHEYRDPGYASLSAWPRSLYRLLMKSYDETELLQFVYECRHNFELEEILKFLKRVGWIPDEIDLVFEFKQCVLPDASGSVWEPQKFLREDPSCFVVFMSKAEKKVLHDLEEIKKKEKKKQTKHKMLPVSASSTGRSKAKVINRPNDAVGSVKNYGTPYNALNSQLHKFMPSQTQAALMAWAHTVANPRTKNPHPVPLMAAPGASASVPQMFKCTLYGTAHANASGCVFIGANADAWYPATPGGESPSGEQWPVPGNRYLVVPGGLPDYGNYQGFPVHYTDASWAGGGSSSAIEYPTCTMNVSSGVTGLNFSGLPSDFIPNMTNDTRYTNVAVELRVRPTQAQLYASGELVAFNYRRQITGETAVGGAIGYGGGQPTGAMLAFPDYYLSRERLAAPNWPSSKWLTTVAVPNTGTAFGQWLPLGGSPPIGTQQVGYPMAFVMGEGLPTGAPIEFEATYVYAVYGTRTYTTSGSTGSDLYVDASRAAPVVANGFTLLSPKASSGRPDARGVAAVVKAEQADNRMPGIKDVISGVKAGKDVFEAVTGTDIGEEIVGIIGDIAAMFL